MTDPPVGRPVREAPADTTLIADDDHAAETRPQRAGRITKWDRPAPPKDWRYFVGGVGRLLITIGLLMFGFVAYQLWGTGIETARAQNRLADQFEEVVVRRAEAAESTTSSSPPPSNAPATTATPATPPATISAGTSPPVTSTATAAPSASMPAVDQPIPPIEAGEVLARLEIPKIGKVGDDALYVVPGVRVEDLKKGPGHYPDTPLPGQLGNAAIAGHRTTYGEPFRNIDQLEPGDEITVTMLTGDEFVYEVTGREIVSPSDYHVVTTTDRSVATLTLTSCHPVYTARQRIVVHAALRPQVSAPVGNPTYYDLAGDDEDDTGNTGDTGGEAGSEPSTSTATAATEATEPTDASSVAAVADDLTSTPPEPQTDQADAFSEGWFHDSAAWPHIAGWALLLLMIAIASDRVSRHFRRHSIGIAAAAIPFVVSLYFFYQNVNRLLPPGL